MSSLQTSDTEARESQRLFFVIDGPDGAGKATQTKRLVSRLESEDIPVKTISFPQYGKKSAGPVEEYLSGTYGERGDLVSAYAASIMFAVDRYDASFRIREWCKAGHAVVTDRYVGSNMAHQGGKFDDAHERRAYLEWNDHLEHTIFGIPRPTLNIILHIPPRMGMRLAKQGATEKAKVRGDIHETDLKHLERAAEVYKELATFPGFVIVDCAPNETLRTVEDIHEEIWSHVCTHLRTFEPRVIHNTCVGACNAPLRTRNLDTHIL